ncbi:MAG: nicotinate-nucleotide adenylyltransferase [Pseudomonadota bacterium]
MLIGLYGGTFNPLHKGHIHAALAVARALELSHIRLLLAARPRHRDQPQTETQHRWRMLQLGCACSDLLVADDREINRAGATYTVDTLREVRAEQPQALPCWVLGFDSFVTLPSWKSWRELLSLCNLVVLDRPGQQSVTAPAEVRALCDAHEVETLSPERVGQIVRLNIPMFEVSATQVRSLVSQEKHAGHLLVPPVYDYIQRHNLFAAMEETV